MGFIHNNHFRAGAQKFLPVPFGFDVIKGDNGKWPCLENGCGHVKAAFQPCNGGRQNKLRLDVELLLQFVLPLLGKLGRTKNGHAADLAAIQQFTGNEQRFHRLADAHVIGNEQAHHRLFHGHQQGDKLIGPGIDSYVSKAAERPCGGPQAQTDGIAQQGTGAGISAFFGVRDIKNGGAHLLQFQRRQYGHDFFIRPAKRLQAEPVAIFPRLRRQYHPIAPTRPDQ